MATGKRTRRTYSTFDRSLVYYTLQSNAGNVKKTSRETGIPVATVRHWRDDWDQNGIPNEVLEACQDIAAEFIDAAERIRHKALVLLEKRIEMDDLRGGEIVSTVAMLTDKINLSKGLATSRNESQQTLQLPSKEEFKALVAGYITEVVSAAETRNAEIIDAELAEIVELDEEQSLRELPAAQEVVI
jgi:transposase-like protein